MKNRTSPKEIKSHLLKNLATIALSVFAAIFLIRSGILDQALAYSANWRIIGNFITGFFFTSAITVGPATAALAALSRTQPIFIIALVGALGSVVGDFLIFKFVRSRITDDFLALVERPKLIRLAHILHLEIFRFFLPFIGALVIASPLPDEIGLAMMGVSKMANKKFFLISYIANFFGIVVVGLVTKALI